MDARAVEQHTLSHQVAAHQPRTRFQVVERDLRRDSSLLAGGTGSELREQVEAIKRWYRNDWIALDNYPFVYFSIWQIKKTEP